MVHCCHAWKMARAYGKPATEINRGHHRVTICWSLDAEEIQRSQIMCFLVVADSNKGAAAAAAIGDIRNLRQDRVS